MITASFSSSRPVCVALLLAALLAGCAVHDAQPGLTVLDADTRRPVPARVRIRNQAGEDHVPAGAQAVAIGPKDQWFCTAGHTRLELPPGRYEIRIERGPEYRPVKQPFEIVDSDSDKHVFSLQRWANMRKQGYVCGENHLHVPPAELAAQLAAEGLDFGTTLQWWNGPRYEVPPGQGFVREFEFGGVSIPASIYDFEIEHAWGAVYVLGMPEALTADDDRHRPNLPIVRQAHDAGALVCYQGGWSREVLLDALLGYVDVVNVCNNNFHRHQFQPRSRYSNLLEVEGFPVYEDTPEGMMRMNTDTYYRLLNCGLRLAAGAGSATGAKKTPVGYNRAYVLAGDDPTLPQFLEAWRAGRSFVTCGPMIDLTVDGRYAPGDTIELGGHPRRVTIKASAVSDQRLTSIEIIVNGRVVSRADKPHLPQMRLVASATLDRGAWIAARCTDEDRLLTDEELAVHHYGDSMPRRPCRLRFAHTSPVYVTLGGRGARVAESIDEARRMLDAFEVFAGREASQAHRDEIMGAIHAARQRLDD